MPQSWHALLAPLPPDAVVERKPVASAEMLAAGTAGPIADWESLTVHLSDVGHGLRHVMVTLDGDGKLLTAGDWVLFDPIDSSQGEQVSIADHHNIGGRFEEDGSFRGTVWHTQSVRTADDVDAEPLSSTPSAPTQEQIDALRKLAADVIRRAPAKQT